VKIFPTAIFWANNSFFEGIYMCWPKTSLFHGKRKFDFIFPATLTLLGKLPNRAATEGVICE
jgi:hypothetical protein